MERRFAVRAAADHFHLVLFADAQAHDADQAVDAGGAASEAQFGAAGECLGALAQQCGRAGMQAAVQGDADMASGFAAAGGWLGNCRCAAGSAELQQRRADVHAGGGQRAQLEAFAIGEDQHRDQALAAACHLVQIEAQQRLALRDPRPFLDQGIEALALQLDGVQAQVQQQLGAVVGLQGHGMTRPRDVHDHTGAGRVEAVVQRVDGDAVAHGAAGEHRVGDAAEGHHGPAQEGFEGQVVVVHGGCAQWVRVTLLRCRGWSGFMPRAWERPAAMT